MKIQRTILVVNCLVACSLFGLGSAKADVTTKPSDLKQTLNQAQKVFQKGKYDKSAALYRGVADNADTAGIKLRGFVGLSKALLEQGKYSEAIGAARSARRIDPTYAPAISILGRLQEITGKDEQALATYKAMMSVIRKGEYRQDARALVALGEILDRYVILSGQKASDQADNIFNNYFRRAYQEVDTKYIPAYVAAGRFALSKHRPETAKKEFDLALKHNPKCVDALVGLAAIELQKWRFEQSLHLIKRARGINPHHVEALLVKAQCLMLWRKHEEAAKAIESALRTNPNHLEALSLAAAVKYCQGNDKAALSYEQRVADINPRYPDLPEAIGVWLSSLRQFDRATGFLEKAIDLAPKRASAWTQLGLIHMQTGREDKAREAFEQAHRIDDFRADVVNYLRILDRLDEFCVRETPHFIIKVDPKYDAILADQVAQYLEEIYPEVTRDYDYQPPFKTLIEIFPTHKEFSIRLSGKGWVGTIGACTGRVIVMVAPHPSRSQFGAFHWESVLRHELAHTITLSATNNLIPHWFTEACAVWQQPDRRNYDAVSQLVDAVRQKKLFSLKTLSWGFVRPKRRGDRSLAYAQSEWILEYIISRHGYSSVIKMLEGFKARKPQQQVFQEVLGVTEEQFDKDFGKWARKEIQKWGFTPDPRPGLFTAQAAAKINPNNATVQANLALALLTAGKYDQAQKAARKALKFQKDQKRALGVLGWCLLKEKKYAEAAKTAQKLEQANAQSPLAPRIAAEANLGLRKWSKAIEDLELCKQRASLDPWAYKELAGLYIQLGRPDDALPNLIELHRRTFDSSVYARQIAEISLAAGADERALEYFRQITRIDPYQPNAYESMASIYRNRREYGKAVETIEQVCVLRPKSADAWTKLAMMRYLSGKSAKSIDQLVQARKDAQKALELEDNPQARRVMEMIEAVLELLKED